jgi:hypothetical protein
MIEVDEFEFEVEAVGKDKTNSFFPSLLIHLHRSIQLISIIELPTKPTNHFFSASMSNAANLNVQVLESLTQLAETLAQLDERGDGSSSVDELTKDASSLNITDSTTTARPSPQSPSSTPNTDLSHYRTLPSTVTTAYTLLTDGSNYIHATSTKYSCKKG